MNFAVAFTLRNRNGIVSMKLTLFYPYKYPSSFELSMVAGDKALLEI